MPGNQDVLMLAQDMDVLLDRVVIMLLLMDHHLLLIQIVIHGYQHVHIILVQVHVSHKLALIFHNHRLHMLIVMHGTHHVL